MAFFMAAQMASFIFRVTISSPAPMSPFPVTTAQSGSSLVGPAAGFCAACGAGYLHCRCDEETYDDHQRQTFHVHSFQKWLFDLVNFSTEIQKF